MKNALIVFGLSLTMLFTACAPKEDDASPETPLVPTVPTPTEPEICRETEADGIHHDVETPTWRDPLLNVDLIRYQPTETKKMNRQQIKAKNDETLRQLYASSTPPQKVRCNNRPGRVSEISPEVAAKLIKTIDLHPVVAYYARTKYEQPGTEIGYCFGRATYVHLALLKLGVAKESIRKIFLVGPMRTGEIDWAFHVAVTVKTTNGQWMVVDNFTGKLLEVHDWVNHFYPYNQKYGNLRVYVTSPSKFTASLGQYSIVQMGLNLPASKDWYRHYFYDLMKWFREHDMTAMGLDDQRYVPADEEGEKPKINPELKAVPGN